MRNLLIICLVQVGLLVVSYSWAQPQGTGGATVSEMFTPALYSEPALSLGLNSVNDSIKNIPAYDTYCGWNTKRLFEPAEKEDLPADDLELVLANSPCDFVYPACGNVTSPFGYRWGRMHYGCDIDLETGDEVQAAFEGMVRISQFHDTYGNVVVIRHNNGLESLYAHLSRRFVTPGDYLEAGDLVGLGGNTGRSYGAHLHFELRYLGHPIDPSVVLNHTEKSLKSSRYRLFKGLFGDRAAGEGYSESGAGGSKKNAVSTKTSHSRYYTIKKGDTLSSIARKNRTTVSRLCRLNSMKESARLRIGQRIKLR